MRYLIGALDSNFNPRSREGSDAVEETIDSGRMISIHAPAKGATTKFYNAHSIDNISIHAPAKGATEEKHMDLGFLSFQSTLPRRERLLSPLSSWWTHLHFNPRSREGSDKSSDFHMFTGEYFNPRSREGSDLYGCIW